MAQAARNPFRFGSLALDEAFADRDDEIRELRSDIENGQDVVLFAPRRFGKSSLVWRVAQQLVRRKALVAQVDLMTTPTLDKLAEKLAKAIHDDVASPLFRAKERLNVFRGLRVTPTVTVNPDDGTFSFSFSATRRREDLRATLEGLLELPAQLGADRGRKVALVLDEFQEVMDVDKELPKLMRSVFQRQPEVAHVYLGSKRHMMERIFNDENEPFWRSAKQIELGVLPAEPFQEHIRERFEKSGRSISTDILAAVIEVTGSHPYATQELCYFLWEETPAGRKADRTRFESALTGVLRSEHAHFSLIWDRASGAQRNVLLALAQERGRLFSRDYADRHGLPGPSGVQRALEGLEREELVRREKGETWIAEPFLAEWIIQEQV
jgi:uncharacterized protein